MKVFSVYQVNRAVCLLEDMHKRHKEIVAEYQLGDAGAHNAGGFLLLTPKGIVERSFVRVFKWVDEVKEWSPERRIPVSEFGSVVRKYDLDPDRLENVKETLFGR